MDAPNLLADYLYLWETTVVRQAIETARASASSGGHSSSYWCQQRQLAARSASPGAPHRQAGSRCASLVFARAAAVEAVLSLSMRSTLSTASSAKLSPRAVISGIVVLAS